MKYNGHEICKRKLWYFDYICLFLVNNTTTTTNFPKTLDSLCFPIKLIGQYLSQTSLSSPYRKVQLFPYHFMRPIDCYLSMKRENKDWVKSNHHFKNENYCESKQIIKYVIYSFGN